MADITVNHVLSGTIDLNANLIGSITPGGKTPVLQTLNVQINPSQAQTITPGTGIDGWNEVKVPQAMAFVLQSDFVLAMGGSAYDTIANKNSIAVYDTSGHNSVNFYKTSPSPAGTSMSEACFATISNPITATVQASGNNTIFNGIKAVEGLVIKGATLMMSGCCKDWLTLKTVDVECPAISISAFENNPLETVILRNATEIGKQAFYYANPTIKNIYIYSETMCTLGRNVFNPNVSAVVHVPESLLASYQADGNWATYTSLTFTALTE